MEPITGAITSFFGLCTSVMNWTLGRSTLKNAADVKAAAKAQDQVDANDKTNEAIKNKDTDELRKEWAE